MSENTPTGAQKELISIIVPCYNEEESIPLFYKEMCRVMDEMQSLTDFEILFVDDGSRDRTLVIAQELAREDPRVRFVSLSRNFGKESAIYAGLQKAKGDYVATMDADLQDPPSLIPKMYADLQTDEGYDCIGTRRITRKGEPPIRSFFARCFYKFINRISKTEFVDGARDFRLMKRQMVNAVLSLAEYNRFSKGLFCWVGFKTKWLEYENIERVAGTTKWSFRALLLYSLEGIISFSTVPLRIPILLGALCWLLSIGIFAAQGIAYLCGDSLGAIWSIVNVISIFAGLQLIALGVVCEYLARMYFEIKNRPIYIVKNESDQTPKKD
jgi:glycosyltransferase involved in cell wall biosynthesis